MAKLHATFLSMVKEPLSIWLNSSVLGRAARKDILSTNIISILESVDTYHEVDDMGLDRHLKIAYSH